MRMRMSLRRPTRPPSRAERRLPSGRESRHQLPTARLAASLRLAEAWLSSCVFVSDCSCHVTKYVPRRGSQASHTSHRLKRQARRLDVPGELSPLAKLSSLPPRHLHHSPALPQPLSSHHASLFSSHAWDTRPFIDCLLPASHNPLSIVFKHHRLPPRVGSCLLPTHKHRALLNPTIARNLIGTEAQFSMSANGNQLKEVNETTPAAHLNMGANGQGEFLLPAPIKPSGTKN